MLEEFFSGASESYHSSQGSNSSHSDSVSSDFSATSATEFNHGLLLSALKAIHSELQRLILGRRKSHHILLGLLAKQRKILKNPPFSVVVDSSCPGLILIGPGSELSRFVESRSSSKSGVHCTGKLLGDC